MEAFWNIQSDGLIANEVDGYLTFSDERGTFFLFIVGVYEFENVEQKQKLIAEIKQQIDVDSEEILVDGKDTFLCLDKKPNEGNYSMFGYKVGSHSITKFAVSIKDYDTKEEIITIIQSLEEEIEP
jgi:hypothetical protein